MNRRLTRSRWDRKIAGVCGGLGIYFGIDPVIIRIAFVVAFIGGFGAPGLLYLILMFVMPEE